MAVTKNKGLDTARLQQIRAVMEEDVAQGRYLGAVIMAGRNGEAGLHEAVGHIDPEKKTAMRKDHVFSLFSVTKALTSALAFRCIERGRFGLTTSVAEVIPEFAGRGREPITVRHLLTHSSGLPPVFSPGPDMYIDRLDEVIEALCKTLSPVAAPDEVVHYSPLAGHALLGEMVRRVDEKQRRFRDIMREDLFEPLGMKDSSVGVRADLRERHVIPHFLQPLPFGHPSRGNYGKDGAFQEEEAEMPWVGCIASVENMYRFAEMLRRGGELDGTRVLSPALLDKATMNYTGDKPNGMFGPLYHSLGWEQPPACLGLGLVLRGEGVYHHHYGTLASPGTFGSMGAGSTVFWVDPVRQMTFVCLRAGVMPEGGSIECYQRLSDMALSAAI